MEAEGTGALILHVSIRRESICGELGGRGSRAEEGLVETESLGRDTEGMGEPSERTVQRHSGHSWECAPQISNWANPRREGHMIWKAQDNEGPAIGVGMEVGRARATKGAVLGRMETGSSQLWLRNVIPFYSITRKKCPTKASIYQNPLVSSLAQPSLFNYPHRELANSLYFWRPTTYLCFAKILLRRSQKKNEVKNTLETARNWGRSIRND